MKKIYPNRRGWLIPLFPLCFALGSQAQEKAPPALSPRMSRQITFIVHAPVLLPAFLQQRSYDSMKNFLGNWKNSDYPSRELIFGAEALLAVETGKFSSYWLPCDCLYYLSDYSRELKNIATQGSQFRYLLKLTQPYSYDATQNARTLLLFLQSWARSLLLRPDLDPSELFVCRTLAGDIPDPQAALAADSQSCPRIALVEKDLSAYNNSVLTSRRDGKRGTAAISLGWWSPTGHLKILGPHPSVGVQLGMRNKRNEYDLTWDLRFGYPTPHPYRYVRQDSVYTTSYYDGGYIGFEYTRYFIHRKYFDLGFTTAIGDDYFAVADGWSQQANAVPLPLHVNSFDWNNGIRLKYFFKRKGYIGLTAKYHLLAYSNPGGTNLSGNAYTLDLSFGSH